MNEGYLMGPKLFACLLDLVKESEVNSVYCSQALHYYRSFLEVPELRTSTESALNMPAQALEPVLPRRSKISFLDCCSNLGIVAPMCITWQEVTSEA